MMKMKNQLNLIKKKQFIKIININNNKRTNKINNLYNLIL